MDKKNLIWLIPSAMILLALSSMPYGYYKLLRIVVCGFCLFLAYKEHEVEPKNLWVWVIGGAAVLYNPLLPLHLGREVWSVVNVISIIGFFIHWKNRKDKIAI